MTRNASQQIFKGQWKELENTIYTNNQQLSLPNFPHSFYITDDGTTIFILKLGNQTVQKFTMTTPWILDTFDGTLTADQTYSLPGTNSDPLGIDFSPDGTTMIVSDNNDLEIYQYTLSIPWDLDSIVAAPVTSTLPGGPGDLFECKFSGDGLAVFVTEITVVVSYILSTPYDVTSTTGAFFSFNPPDINAYGVTINSDGTFMALSDSVSNTIRSYILSTPNHANSAVYTGQGYLTLGNPADSPESIQWKPNGKALFILDPSGGALQKSELGDAYDLNTAGFTTNFKGPLPQPQPRQITWRPDGLFYYYVSSSNNFIKRFTALQPFMINDDAETGSAQIGGTVGNAFGMAWNYSNGAPIVLGPDNDTIYELTFPTPWDPSSWVPGTTNDTFQYDSAIALEDPNGVTFSYPGGNYLFLATLTTVYRWTLSAPFTLPVDLTAPDKSFVTVEGNMREVVFQEGGRRMITINAGTSVKSYLLSDLWDPTTAIFEQEVFLNFGPTSNTNSLFFSPYANKVYTGQVGTSNIVAYDLSSDFNNNLIDNFGNDLVTENDDNLVWA